MCCCTPFQELCYDNLYVSRILRPPLSVNTRTIPAPTDLSPTVTSRRMLGIATSSKYVLYHTVVQEEEKNESIDWGEVDGR